MSNGALTHLDKIEASLWKAAGQLRANSKLTNSEHCMPMLGVILPARPSSALTLR